jgi:signal transduction histidine kinase
MTKRDAAPSPARSMRGRSGAALLWSVAVAVAASSAALTASLLLSTWLPHTRLLLFYGGVIAAAWFGGARGGILATVLCALAAEYFLFAPSPGFEASAAAAVRVGLFAATALASVALLGATQRSRALAEVSAAEARLMAGQLEEQALALGAQITESRELAEDFQRINLELQAKTDAAERSARRTRRVQATVAALLRAITPQQVARVVVEEALGAIEADAGVLALADADGRGVRVATAKGWGGDRPDRLPRLPIESGGAIPVAIRTNEPVWSPGGAERDALLGATVGDAAAADTGGGDDAGDLTWAVLPLPGRERALGAIALGFRRAIEFSEEERTLMLLLAQECGQALERARLYEAERSARVKAEFAERQIAFLAEASNRLASSLDYTATLQSVARLAVPELADLCTIHVAADGGGLRLLAAEHVDADRAELLREIGRRFPPRPTAPMGAGRVHRTAEPELVRDVTQELLESGAWDADHLALLRRLGARSEICVPMVARDQVLGTITLVVAESGRRYTPADLALAEEVASRAAQAIENARLYEDTRTASQAKSDFLAVMSHELRTPLNAVLGYADLMLLGVSDSPAKSREYVERIRAAAQGLLRLVDEVLSFARLEAGREEVRLEPIDVNAVVREAVALVEQDAAEKHIRIELRLPESPVELETDAWKLRQILTNLLSNAVKFTAEGFIAVGVEVEPTGVRIAVRDTGIGISPEHMEHIFDAFWQVEQSATRRYGGMGLGLGVARELAKLLGGELTVQSEVGAGSTFTLRLPVRPARTRRPVA